MDPQLNPRPGPVTPGLCLSAAVTTERIRCKVNGGSSSCCRAQRWRHRDQRDAVEIGLCCERLQWSDVWTRVVSVEVRWCWTPTLDPVLRAAGNKQQITDRAATWLHDWNLTWLCFGPELSRYCQTIIIISILCKRNYLIIEVHQLFLICCELIN